MKNDVMESVRLLMDIPKSVYDGFINNCYTRNDMIAIHNSIMHAQKVQKGEMNKMINEGLDIEVKPDQTIKGVMLDTLAKESPQVIETAYIYAKNYVAYGIDITKAWSTAVEQTAILHRVKMDSFYEGYSECRKQLVDAKDVDFKSISVDNKVFLDSLTKRCNELVASGELPIEYMDDWFKKELGLPYTRSEIFEEISKKI